LNKLEKACKKIRIHKRITRAFFGVLFFAFILTAIVFDLGRQQAADLEISYILRQYGYVVEELIQSRTHWLMLAFVAAIFIAAAVGAYFVSVSITRPIEQLSQFAVGIGKGNFTPNELEFADLELSELNDALNKSVKQLETYDKEQKTFFQNASHELRTPLMSIKCYAEGITAGIMQPEEAANTILQETDKLTELVKELLYVSQIDNISNTYIKENIDLVQLVKERVARQKAQADARHIEFVYELGASALPYKCVFELLGRALDNLISNAIRYAKSQITISMHLRGGYIGIKVADDGAGIHPGVIPHIFERFYKGEGGNTGIGLSIVKSIVEQHKGTIAVENSDTGAVFTIILPT